jgi:hypothetical protein
LPLAISKSAALEFLAFKDSLGKAYSRTATGHCNIIPLGSWVVIALVLALLHTRSPLVFLLLLSWPEGKKLVESTSSLLHTCYHLWDLYAIVSPYDVLFSSFPQE